MGVSFKKELDKQSLLEMDDCMRPIPEALKKEYQDACRTIIEMVARTPHILPFAGSAKNKMTSNAINEYRNAIFHIINVATDDVFYDEKFDEPVGLEISDAVKTIYSTAREWVVLKEKEDENFLDVVGVGNNRIYKILSANEKKQVEEYFNQFSKKLREKLMGIGFREKLHSFKRNSTEIYKQLMRVAGQAWAKHSSILLIRLDWGQKYRVPDLRGKFISEEDFQQKFDVVSGYRIKMLQELRNIFGKDIAFYAWKIECTPVKGLHMHWFIGLNGAKHQDRINIPKMIAKRWDELLGDENAYTWNLNANQKNENAILRVLDYNDPMLWNIVGGYSDYLAKVDYLVRHRTPKGARSFGCTNLIHKKKKSKTGPLRKKNMAEIDLLKVRNFFTKKANKKEQLV